MLDASIAKYDEDAPLRPTILSIGDQWIRTTKNGLLSPLTTDSIFGPEKRKIEKNRAYDLIDSLTNSGVLTLDGCSLHVMLCATHCFDKTLLNVIVRDNVNPIETVERSAMIVACTVQMAKSEEMVLEGEERRRMELYSPSLF